MQYYSVNDGLPQGSVYEIYQAKNGVMWIGTGDGLCSYDGANYTIYRKNLHDTNGLLHNRIRKIGEDETGNIYINSDRGLNILDAFTGKITTPTINPQSTSDSLFFLFAVGNDVYLVKNRTELWCYHSGKKELEKKADLNRPLNTPQQTFRIGNEFYYFHTINELAVFNCVTLKSRSINISQLGFNNLFFGNNRLYLYTLSGIYELSTDKNSFVPTLLNKYYPTYTLGIDGQGNTWISPLEKGLVVYNPKGELIHEFPNNYQAQKFDGLSLKVVTKIHTDRSGNVWVGTEGNGLVKFNLNGKKFSHVNSHPSIKNGLKIGFIKCFYQSKAVGKVPAGLWVGTYMGGIHLKKPDGSFIQYKEMNTCFSVTQDNNGNLWAASDSGIFIMDIYSGKFSQFRSFVRGYSIPKLHNGELLYSDIEGSYIVTPNAGSRDYLTATRNPVLYTYSPSHGGFIPSEPIYSTLSLNKNHILNSAVRPFKGCPPNVLYFHETRNGNVFICIEEDGIYVSNKLALPRKMVSNSALDKATVRCIYEANEGTLYLATNIGLVVMSKELAIQKIYTLMDGLPNDVLYSVIPDRKNNLWISSNKGISKFTVSTRTFRNYTVDDGIQSNEFNTGAWYSDTSNALIYLGGVNGYNVFNPELIRDNPHVPSVMLSGMKIFDKELVSDTVLNRKRNIHLIYTQNSLTFEFTAPEFTNYDKNSYAYKLIGVDEEWVMAGNRRYATYGNLAPGSYQLLAKASNNDGVWGTEKQLLHITISPPWWRTMWFYISFSILMLAVIGFLIYRITTVRLRRQLAELTRQREIEAVRSRISRDIHDDVGAGLSHLALTSDLARMKLGKDPIAIGSELSDQLTNISDNSRKLIDSLSEIIWSVNPRFDNLANMLSYMRNYISEYLENSGITVDTDIPESLQDRPVKPEIRRNIFLVLKESLHNIVKHANAKHVTIVLKISGGQFELSIHDDGKGMDVNSLSDPIAIGFGNGMVNMKRRAEEIHGKLSVESKYGHGTTIKINGTFM